MRQGIHHMLFDHLLSEMGAPSAGQLHRSEAFFVLERDVGAPFDEQRCALCVVIEGGEHEGRVPEFVSGIHVHALVQEQRRDVPVAEASRQEEGILSVITDHANVGASQQQQFHSGLLPVGTGPVQRRQSLRVGRIDREVRAATLFLEVDEFSLCGQLVHGHVL